MCQLEIRVHNSEGYRVSEDRLVRAAQAILDQHPAQNRARLSIVITSDNAMTELNRRYRQSDGPTDVLSFAAPALPAEISNEQAYLGDVVIAHEFASAQAAKKGACPEDTLCLLAIHGTLHLLGYTHDTAEACELMWTAQANALQCLGINLALVDRYETVQPA